MTLEMPVAAELPEGSYVDVAFEVERNYEGWRLDRYLTAKLKNFSRERAAALVATARGDRRLKPSTRVHTGLRFVLRRPSRAEPPTPTEVPILHRDEWIVVVDKPAGLPVHPNARYHLGTLVHVLRRAGVGAEPVHRLDRETSGLVVCARTAKVSCCFMHAFQRGEVHKQYLAICEGTPPDEFVVDAPLAVGGRIVRIAVRVDPESGRPARTRFAVVRRFTRGETSFALLRAFPETGRQHQIRAHLREAGFPIVGDKIYGPDEMIYDRFVRRALTPYDWSRLHLARHALHAYQLEFTHPGTGLRVRFEAPLAADLATFVNDAATTI